MKSVDGVRRGLWNSWGHRLVQGYGAQGPHSVPCLVDVRNQLPKPLPSLLSSTILGSSQTAKRSFHTQPTRHLLTVPPAATACYQRRFIRHDAQTESLSTTDPPSSQATTQHTHEGQNPEGSQASSPRIQPSARSLRNTRALTTTPLSELLPVLLTATDVDEVLREEFVGLKRMNTFLHALGKEKDFGPCKRLFEWGQSNR